MPTADAYLFMSRKNRLDLASPIPVLCNANMLPLTRLVSSAPARLTYVIPS